MSEIQAKSDAGAFGTILQEWANTNGRTIGEVLRSEGKKVIGRAIRFTPNQKGKKSQELIVARDVRRAVRPLNPEVFTSPRLRKLAESSDYVGMNAALKAMPGGGVTLASEDGRFRLKEVVPFSPALHERARNKRGRVSFRKLGFGTFDRDAVAAQIAKKQKNVGMARAGWAPAMVGLGGTVTAYIRRHQGQGSFEDQSRSSVRAFIRSKNFSPWASDSASAKIVMENAVRSRGRDIADELTRRLGGGLAIAMKGVAQ